METNFKSQEVLNLNELIKFANKIRFPSHGLILRARIRGKNKNYKGIVNWQVLINCYQALKGSASKIIVETDMRAMYNPTRMEVIRNATLKLIKKVNTSCPNCSAPGFGHEKSLYGLECSQCSFPTNSIKAHVFQCQKCFYEELIEFPNFKIREDPTFCDFCNP